MIRSLAFRLIAGQGPGGGWSYRCAFLSPVDEELLLNFLKKTAKFANTNAVVMHPHLRPLPKALESLIDPLVRKSGRPRSEPRRRFRKNDLARSHCQGPSKKPEAPPKNSPGKPEVAPPPLLNEPKADGPGAKGAPKKDDKPETPKPGPGAWGRKSNRGRFNRPRCRFINGRPSPPTSSR